MVAVFMGVLIFVVAVIAMLVYDEMMTHRVDNKYKAKTLEEYRYPEDRVDK